MSASRHSLPTRLLHASLAATVVIQLFTSLVMRHPRGADPGNIFFPLHEYSGIAAFGLALLFWLTVVGRRIGTDPGALFPWFSVERRRAFWADLRRYAESARSFGLPAHDEAAAFPSAIHGLGLLLVTYMGLSGTFWYVMSLYGLGRSEWVRPVMELHGAFGNLVWAYLLGHAALGMLHHVTRNQPLTVMWSLRP